MFMIVDGVIDVDVSYSPKVLDSQLKRNLLKTKSQINSWKVPQFFIDWYNSNYENICLFPITSYCKHG